MENICIVIRRAPYGTLAAAEGVRHLLGAGDCGLPATAVLVDDGVFAAKHGQDPQGTGWISLSVALQNALTPGASRLSPQIRVYVHQPSLRQRGIDSLDIIPGLELVDDTRLAEVIAAAEGLLIF